MRSRHSVENGSIQLVGDGVLTVYNSVENPKRCDNFSKRLLEKVKQERIYHKWNIAHKTIFCNWKKRNLCSKKTIEKYENKTSGFAEWIEHEIPEGLTVFNIVPDSIGVRRKLRTANMIEFQNKELKKLTRCIKLFPNRESLLRIATALLIELDETWLSESKRYI